MSTARPKSSALRGLLAGDCYQPLADVAWQRRRPAVGADVDDRVSTVDADHTAARDLPRPRDRRRSDPFGAYRYRDRILEAQHLAEVRLDAAARVVDEPVDESELTHESRLRPLCVAERRGEVDPSARIGVDPCNAKALDVSAAVTH